MYHPIKFGCKKISSSADIVDTVIVIGDPELEDSKPIFLHDTLAHDAASPQSMMMHHHTKFGYKRFSNRGDIAKMNIHWNFELFL